MSVRICWHFQYNWQRLDKIFGLMKTSVRSFERKFPPRFTFLWILLKFLIITWPLTHSEFLLNYVLPIPDIWEMSLAKPSEEPENLFCIISLWTYSVLRGPRFSPENISERLIRFKFSFSVKFPVSKHLEITSRFSNEHRCKVL